MAKKLHGVTVKGNQHEWTFHTLVDPQYLAEWRSDGLEINEIYNTIPEWVVDARLARVWCVVQDLFNFKNPFSGSK